MATATKTMLWHTVKKYTDIKFETTEDGIAKLTINRPEVRNAFSKNGGNAGEEGSVGWMFKSTGVISLPKSAIAEEALFELATENGADDFDASGEEYEIRVDPAHYHALLEIIQKKGLPTSSAELSKVAENMIKLSGESSDKAIALLEALDDLDDVQNVHTNAEFENP